MGFINDIHLGNRPLLLAPMENITDPSFRLLCRREGASMVFTEFVSADELLHGTRHALEKMNICDEERPVGIQLYGHIPGQMAEAARRAGTLQPEVIDLNFGCPARKIARRGAGAGMLRNIPAMIEISSRVAGATDIPVTVKTRLGWDENHKDLTDIALRLQDAGIRAITVHGRTGNQGFRGEADWSLIGELKNHPGIEIPVIGNGDITSPEQAAGMFGKYGVDGIMIGRAAIGKPWLFRQIRNYLDSGEIPPSPGLKERTILALTHLEGSISGKGMPRGIYEMRGHFIRYFQEYPEFEEIRKELLTSTDPDRIRMLLQSMPD